MLTPDSAAWDWICVNWTCPHCLTLGGFLLYQSNQGNLPPSFFANFSLRMFVLFCQQISPSLRRKWLNFKYQSLDLSPLLPRSPTDADANGCTFSLGLREGSLHQVAEGFSLFFSQNNKCLFNLKRHNQEGLQVILCKTKNICFKVPQHGRRQVTYKKSLPHSTHSNAWHSFALHTS